MARAAIFRRRVAEDVAEIQRFRRRRLARWITGRAVSGAVSEASDSSAGSGSVKLACAGALAEARDTSAGNIAVAIRLNGSAQGAGDLGSAAARVALHCSAAASESGDGCSGHAANLASYVIDPNYLIVPRAR